MFAGKTEHVIAIARRYRAIKKNVLFVNHIIDNRYSNDNVVMSHNGTKMTCLKVVLLESILTTKEYQVADLVVIEEGQFFQDLYKFFRENDQTRDFIVSGLSGDVNMKSIGQILELIPMADKLEKLDGFCQECKDGTLGSFTKKLDTVDGPIIQVGSWEMYSCVCRRHHNNTF